MAETVTSSGTRRYAVVTGGSKRIGFGICRQLASHGIMVVLTARDEKKALEALEKLKGSGLSDHLVFHLPDVADPSSVASLADFIKTQFGRLDIWVNNVGINGVIVDGDAIRAAGFADGVEGSFCLMTKTSEWSSNEVDLEEFQGYCASLKKDYHDIGTQVNWNDYLTQTYHLAQECFQTNYYGAKRMVEAFLPLLQLSDSPRIVNVSSSRGKLKYIPNEWAKGVFRDVDSLTEEKVDEVLNEFLKDFKEGSLEDKGWPTFLPAYTVSKAAMNAYTRILAMKYPNLINSVCPGYVKTDNNFNTGILTVEEGAESPVRLALLPDGSPSGLFFDRKEVSSVE